MNTYIATIKWRDNGEVQEDMVLKTSYDRQNDDDVFYYVTDEEIKSNGTNDWEIIKLEKQTMTNEELLVEEIYQWIMSNEDMGMGESADALYEAHKIVQNWKAKCKN
jgi:hypothetical protein